MTLISMKGEKVTPYNQHPYFLCTVDHEKPPLGKIVQRNKHHASMNHWWGRSGKDGARVSVTECSTPQ